MSKKSRNYTTKAEAKQLAKLSIYKKYILPEVDMHYEVIYLNGYTDDGDTTEKLLLGKPKSKYDTPIWSVGALINVARKLFDQVFISEERVSGLNQRFSRKSKLIIPYPYDIPGYDPHTKGECLANQLVELLKMQDLVMKK